MANTYANLCSQALNVILSNCCNRSGWYDSKIPSNLKPNYSTEIKSSKSGDAKYNKTARCYYTIHNNTAVTAVSDSDISNSFYSVLSYFGITNTVMNEIADDRGICAIYAGVAAFCAAKMVRVKGVLNSSEYVIFEDNSINYNEITSTNRYTVTPNVDNYIRATDCANISYYIPRIISIKANARNVRYSVSVSVSAS